MGQPTDPSSKRFLPTHGCKALTQRRTKSKSSSKEEKQSLMKKLTTNAKPRESREMPTPRTELDAELIRKKTVNSTPPTCLPSSSRKESNSKSLSSMSTQQKCGRRPHSSQLESMLTSSLTSRRTSKTWALLQASQTQSSKSSSMPHHRRPRLSSRSTSRRSVRPKKRC